MAISFVLRSGASLGIGGSGFCRSFRFALGMWPLEGAEHAVGLLGDGQRYPLGCTSIGWIKSIPRRLAFVALELVGIGPNRY